MPIINITPVQTGLVGVLPSTAYIQTSDSIATVKTTGYLNHEVQNGIQFSLPCIASVSTQASPTSQPQVGWYQVVHVGNNWSLVNATDPYDVNGNISANNFIPSYATTVTAAGTTTLTVASPYFQYFTGTTTQTLKMPVTTTLAVGQSWFVVNNSTGNVTVQSSGSNTIQTMATNSWMLITCILASGTTAASWGFQYVEVSDASGAVLLSPSGDQTITAHNLTLGAGNYLATLGTYASGSVSGGVVGKFTAFSTTAASGSVALQAANSAGNFANILTNLSTSAARTWSLPDASGTIALTSGSAGFTFNSVAGTTQTAVAGNAYALNNAGATTVTLPTTVSSTLGDTIKIKGASAAPFIIQAAAGQTIKYGATASSVAGTATSNAGTDSIQLVYVAANTWSVDWALSSGFVLA